MSAASEALYRLKPVRFRYKKEIDESQALDYGLLAEDVAEVDPNLAVRNRSGEIESVKYTAVNSMLLNEFLKEHQTVQEQQATIAELKANATTQAAAIAGLQKQTEGLAAGLQKVSAHLDLNKPAPHTVLIRDCRRTRE